MTKHRDITEEIHIKNLIKNFNLLRIVEKFENRKTSNRRINNKEGSDKDLFIASSNTLSSTKKKKVQYNSKSKHKKNLSNKFIEEEKSDLPNDDDKFERMEMVEKVGKLFSEGSKKMESNNNISNLINNKNSAETNSNNIKPFKILEGLGPEIKCKKHNLSIIAYVIGTNMLYCEKCMEESPMKAFPLPSVVKEYKKKVDSSRLLTCLLKHEINRLFEFFESYQDEFEKSNKQKIDDLFAYLYKIISYNYNTAIQILRQCKGEQKAHIDLRILELKELESELDEISEGLDSIQAKEEKDQLNVYNNLNDIYERLMNFMNYDSELSLLTMKIGLKNEMKDDIFQIIQDSYYVDVEFANIQGEAPTIKHILQKTQFWSCFCGELNNPMSEIICLNCSAFRRMETLPNFYSNPDLFSSDDLKLLSLRRRTESKMFQDFIKETEVLLLQGRLFYVVEIEWFLLWKCFVTNDLSEKNLTNNKKKISVNKQIGVLPPGPINNSFLFNKPLKEYSDKTIKKGLSKNDEYVIVNEKVWNLFYNNYNGGPEIKLKKNDDLYQSLTSCTQFDYSPYYDFSFIDQELQENSGQLNQLNYSNQFKNQMNSSGVQNNSINALINNIQQPEGSQPMYGIKQIQEINIGKEVRLSDSPIQVEKVNSIHPNKKKIVVSSVEHKENKVNLEQEKSDDKKIKTSDKRKKKVSAFIESIDK